MRQLVCDTEFGNKCNNFNIFKFEKTVVIMSNKLENLEPMVEYEPEATLSSESDSGNSDDTDFEVLSEPINL